MPSASLSASAADGAVGGPGATDRAQELEFLLGHLPGFAYRSRRNASTWFLEYVSAGVEAATGYSVADLLETRTQSTATIMDPEDQTWFWPALQVALEAGKPYAFEYRIRTAAGEQRWLLDKGRGLYAEGRLVGAAGFATDITDRKRTEAELRASRDELAGLFESSSDANFIADAETGIILDANSAAVRLMGIPRERLIGMHQAQLHPPHLEGHVRAVFRAHVEGRSTSADTEVLTGDGRAVPVRIVGGGSAQRHGRRVVQGSFRDLTGTVEAEQALRDSERRYRRLFELESDAIVVLDNDSCCILDANRAAEQLYGYRRDELLAMRSLDLSAEPTATRQVTRSLTAHVPLRYHRRKDGTVFPVEITGSYFEEGPRTIHIAAIRDITARMAAEGALRESAREREALLNNLPGFAFRCAYGPPHAMEYISDGVQPLTGYPATDFIHNRVRSFASILHAEDIARVTHETHKAVEARQPYVLEYRILTASGEERWLWEKGCGVYEGGTPIAVEGFATDVTERHHAEALQQALQARLNQAQKMELVGRLAGGVAHDFNNLLTVILGCASMAAGEERDPQVLTDLRQIQRAGERARSLTRQLLAFSRKQVLDLLRTNLNRVVLDYVDLLRRLIGEDIVVQTHLQPDLREIRGDAAQLAQALMNLAANARDAMAGGGTLTLRTANLDASPDNAAAMPGLAPGAYVLLEVADSGCGMDSETQKHLFEPFFTTKPVGKGTGLGLATIYGIVEQHGGHITCESSPGRGSTFRIWLPALAAEPAAAEAAAPEREPRGGSEAILLVEDDPAVLDMAATYIGRYGYHVVRAGSGAEALHLAASMERLDLLISDVIMPGMDGRQLHAALTALRPGVKVLYMSGYPGDLLSARGQLEAGIRLVQKPFTAAGLAAGIREVLDQAPAGPG